MFPDGPKVVVLLATFNGAKYLPAQLQSIKDQRHENWELVASDDGSCDCSVETLRSFSRGVRQRVIIIEGPRKGFWRNFLSLVRRADCSDIQGDLFAFCDQDDVWLNDKLQRAVEWFRTRPPDVPAVYFSRTQLMNEDGTITGLSPLFRRPTSFQNALVQSIGGGNTMVLNQPAKSLLVRAPADITLVSHDWWAYMVVTGAGGHAFFDPVPTLKYRQHENNLVGANRGGKARLVRLGAFINGRARRWNDTNIRSLNRMRSFLSDSALQTLDQFSSARAAPIPKRITLMSQSQVYRQGRLETLCLYLGAWLGLI
jgi:glycosyltransferase involved in cell wall biosynthesis